MGNSRTGTAVDISSNGWGDNSVNCVFLAAGWSFPDALAAVPLAYAYDAPILMVNKDKNSLSSETIAEIKRLNPSKVYILGGTFAVGTGVNNQLIAEGFNNIERIAGSNRQSTAVDVAVKLKAELGTVTTAFLVNGWNYPDALGGAPAAATNGYPILFSRLDYVPAETLAALQSLGITKVIILGGNKAVSDAVYNTLDAIYDVERISGSSRVETALAIQKRFFPESGSYKYVFVSTAYNYADALTGGVLAAKANCPMVLIKNALPIPATVKDYISKTECEKVIVFGGANAISDAVKNQLE